MYHTELFKHDLVLWLQYSQRNVFTGLIHDAVLMWAYGVNRTLESGGAPDDGETIANNIFNLSFPRVTGDVQAALHHDAITFSS